jgi:acetyl-CoA carboxylase carboxyltransferase component
MCDEAVIVRNQGTIFLAGPPLVKAATGEEVTAEELGGGDTHTRISGVADHLAENDADALRIAREIFAAMPRTTPTPLARATPELPAYDPEEIYGIVARDPRKQTDARELIARMVDGSRFHEFKALYGPTLVTGFAHLHGYPVGILANQGVLFSESALAGQHFIELASARIPLVFPQNITGFIVGSAHEQGRIVDGAKMVNAVANAAVRSSPCRSATVMAPATRVGAHQPRSVVVAEQLHLGVAAAAGCNAPHGGSSSSRHRQGARLAEADKLTARSGANHTRKAACIAMARFWD